MTRPDRERWPGDVPDLDGVYDRPTLAELLRDRLDDVLRPEVRPLTRREIATLAVIALIAAAVLAIAGSLTGAATVLISYPIFVLAWPAFLWLNRMLP